MTIDQASPPQHNYVGINGIRMHYVEAGTDQHVSDLETACLPGTSHSVQQEEHQKTNDLLQAHLAEARRGG